MMVTSFRPVAKAKLYRASGYDVTGKPRFEEAGDIGMSPIRLDAAAGPTSIRTDKSGSQGRAEEVIFVGRVLVHPKHKLALGDLMEIYGIKYKIESIFPRYDMAAILNHLQVDLTSWRE